jgi:uncharacterized protein (TIGR03086 family)
LRQQLAQWCVRPIDHALRMRHAPDDGSRAYTKDGGVTDTSEIARLIRLGRDREAAELGVAMTNGGTTMDALAQLDQLGPVLQQVMSGLSPADLDRPTPCAELTVRGVLEHMIGGATIFAAAYRGEEPALPDAAVDPLGAIGPALGALIDAVHQPGALDRTISAPFGDVPGETFARYLVLDGLVHGWDLATATGQPYDPPAALVAEADAYAHDAIDAMRNGDAFKLATTAPAGASPIEQLAAYTGRTVS